MEEATVTMLNFEEAVWEMYRNHKKSEVDRIARWRELLDKSTELEKKYIFVSKQAKIAKAYEQDDLLVSLEALKVAIDIDLLRIKDELAEHQKFHELKCCEFKQDCSKYSNCNGQCDEWDKEWDNMDEFLERLRNITKDT